MVRACRKESRNDKVFEYLKVNYNTYSYMYTNTYIRICIHLHTEKIRRRRRRRRSAQNLTSMAPMHNIYIYIRQVYGLGHTENEMNTVPLPISFYETTYIASAAFADIFSERILYSLCSNDATARVLK